MEWADATFAFLLLRFTGGAARTLAPEGGRRFSALMTTSFGVSQIAGPLEAAAAASVALAADRFGEESRP